MTEKLKKCLFNKEFETITKQGCISYINSYIETMQDRIAQGDPRKPLYEERFLFFTKAIEFLKAADENQPLTLDELRQMNGEPVWIVAHPDWGHWELSMDAEDYFEDRDPDLYGLTMPSTVQDSMGRYGLNMLGWLAYRRKPEVRE